jgi:hypothetical protein
MLDGQSRGTMWRKTKEVVPDEGTRYANGKNVEVICWHKGCVLAKYNFLEKIFSVVGYTSRGPYSKVVRPLYWMELPLTPYKEGK